MREERNRSFRAAAATAATACAAVLLSAAPAVGQNAGNEADQEPVFAMWFGGADAMLVHEKDAGLRRALGLIDERLAEVPNELRGVVPDAPPQEINNVVRVARGLAGSSFAFEITITDEYAYPTFTVWPGDQAAAERLDAAWRALLRDRFDMQGEPGADGLRRAEDWDGRVGFAGVVDSRMGPAFVAGIERPGGGTPDAYAGPTEGFATFNVDLRNLPLSAETFDGEQMVIDVLEYVGVMGDNAWRLETVIRHEGDELVAEGVVREARTVAERFGIRPGVIVQPNVLRIVPQDATMVSALAYDFASAPDAWAAGLRRFGLDVADGNSPQWLRSANGIIEPLFRALGDDLVFYRSLTTGGGGILSTIYTVGVRDERAVEIWLDRWVGVANGAGAGFLRGYVTIEKSTYGEADMWSLRTTGLPLPLDVSFAIGGGRLVAGLTASNVAAALDQQKNGQTSVMDNQTFTGVLLDELAEPGIVTLSWTDMAHRARESHWVAQAISVSAANAVRSRFGGGRDAGDITPRYNEYIQNVRPAYSVFRWRGDDLAGYSRSDGSVLVNMSAGVLETAKSQWAQLVGSVLGPALFQARSAAQRVRGQAELAQAQSNVRQLAITMIAYAMENDGAMPGSIDELIEAGFLDNQAQRALSSPFGPAIDGGGDIGIRTSIGDIDDIDAPSDTIVAIDRAAYLAGERVAIAMADGSIMMISVFEADQRLDNQFNEGAREDFDL